MTTTKPFDLTKPVQTRSGRPVRILCTDRFGNIQIVALVHEGHREIIVTAYVDGRLSREVECSHDLVNVPKITEKFVNIYRGNNLYKDHVGVPRASLAEAVKAREGFKTSIIKLLYEDDDIVDVELVKEVGNSDDSC